MRILVCGGRDFADIEEMRRVIGAFDRETTVVIHGAARGADHLAGVVALERGMWTWACPAFWSIQGRAAGAIRNRRMLAEARPELVIAFPGGRGTTDMIQAALAQGGIEVRTQGWLPGGAAAWAAVERACHDLTKDDD